MKNAKDKMKRIPEAYRRAAERLDEALEENLRAERRRESIEWYEGLRQALAQESGKKRYTSGAGGAAPQ